MFDEDKAQEKEFKQQQVVEGIVSSLHNLPRDDINYRVQFRLVAQCILSQFGNEDAVRGQEGADFFKIWAYSISL